MSCDLVRQMLKLAPMLKLGFAICLLAIVGCSALGPTSPPDAWMAGEKKPKRLVIILLKNLTPEATDLNVLPNFQRLKSHSLSFAQASLGHLFPVSSVSHLVLTTGRFPRHLPLCDDQFWDRSGLLGARNRFYSVNKLSASDFSKILSPVSPSLLRKVPGPPNSKLVIAPRTDEAFPLASPTTESRILTGVPPAHLGSEKWVTDGILSFFNTEPDWRMVLASFDNPSTDFSSSDEQLGRLLDFLEQKNLLNETAIILTSHPTIPTKSTALRYYLKNKDLKSVLKFASQLKTTHGISEIYYKKEISGRFYYIRTFRSSHSKNETPGLLQSLGSDHSPDVIGFLEGAADNISLLVWSPNIRFDNPAIRNQVEQAPVRIVDIHPIALELLGLPQDSSLDGSSLGIQSLIY
ncbi:MAG: hypothetical protein EBQ92_14130 [Proteobacteria bacterium]|nr:hypothetical protein [Pseudomonadota bacterium]